MLQKIGNIIITNFDASCTPGTRFNIVDTKTFGSRYVYMIVKLIYL